MMTTKCVCIGEIVDDDNDFVEVITTGHGHIRLMVGNTEDEDSNYSVLLGAYDTYKLIKLLEEGKESILKERKDNG